MSYRRCAQPFICLRQAPCNLERAMFHEHASRARSKFNQTSKRLPAPARDADPHCDSWIQDELPVLPRTLSRSLSRPPYSFCRPSTQHPTPCILLELHSQFPPRSPVKPIARELQDSAERGSPFGKLNPVSNPPGVFLATCLTRRATSRTSVSSFTSLHRNVYAFG